MNQFEQSQHQKNEKLLSTLLESLNQSKCATFESLKYYLEIQGEELDQLSQKFHSETGASSHTFRSTFTHICSILQDVRLLLTHAKNSLSIEQWDEVETIWTEILRQLGAKILKIVNTFHAGENT
jgi:hypothetical protein